MLIILKIWLKVPRAGCFFFANIEIIAIFVTSEGHRLTPYEVADNYGRLTERDDIQYRSAFFIHLNAKLYETTN
jgi:hypothetical protein